MFWLAGQGADALRATIYDHSVPARELFDAETSDAICTMLASEMQAFGYTPEGLDSHFAYGP